MDVVNENISENKEGDVLYVKITLNSVSASITLALKEYLLGKIEGGDVKILLDLSNLGYMDSSFLGALVLSLKKAAAKGGSIKLIIPDDRNPIRTMFENTQMFNLFDAFPDEETALNNFK